MSKVHETGRLRDHLTENNEFFRILRKENRSNSGQNCKEQSH